MAYIATFQGRAANEHLNTVKEALVELARRSRLEPRTIRYDFYQQKDDPAVFLLFAIWEDESAWRAHINADAHKEHVASLPEGAWAEPPVQTRLEALDALP